LADKLIEAGANLTPETFLEVYRAWRLGRREQSESGTAVARIGKKMKDVGINKMAFDIFEKLSQLDTDEAVTVMKCVMRYASWTGKGYAVQQDFFTGLAIEKPKDKAKVEFSEFEIEDLGYKAGYDGQPIDNNPYEPSDANDPAYTIWRAGWNAGQAARVHKSFGGEAPNTSSSPGRRGRPRKDKGTPPANDDGLSVH